MDHYRFFVPDLVARSGNPPVRLADDQAHHARTVLRLAGGEPVTLFDGKGAWAHGRFIAESKREAAIKLTTALTIDPPPVIRLTLATAVPKGDRAEWLVEQASQLNVWRIQWLESERGVVKPGGGKIEKWRRLAVESAKQCGRTHLLQIVEMASLETVLQSAAAGHERILWLEPRDDPHTLPVQQAVAGAQSIIALVGPEGGWSGREFQLLESAATRKELTRVRVAQNVLRIETACTALAAQALC